MVKTHVPHFPLSPLTSFPSPHPGPFREGAKPPPSVRCLNQRVAAVTRLRDDPLPSLLRPQTLNVLWKSSLQVGELFSQHVHFHLTIPSAYVPEKKTLRPLAGLDTYLANLSMKTTRIDRPRLRPECKAAWAGQESLPRQLGEGHAGAGPRTACRTI